jgi:hypothetical protein
MLYGQKSCLTFTVKIPRYFQSICVLHAICCSSYTKRHTHRHTPTRVGNLPNSRLKGPHV